jgi:hypothetical protein
MRNARHVRDDRPTLDWRENEIIELERFCERSACRQKRLDIRAAQKIHRGETFRAPAVSDCARLSHWMLDIIKNSVFSVRNCARMVVASACLGLG